MIGCGRTVSSLLFCLILSLPLKAGIHSGSGEPEKSGIAAVQLEIYSMPPTAYNQLTGVNIPSGILPVTKLTLRMCKGEFEPLSLFLQPRTPVNNIKFSWSDFSGYQGSFSKNELDVSVVKVWYQSGILSSQTNNKHLTQEVLVKNDRLIMADYNTQTNYLLVNKNGSSYYQNISDPAVAFPADVIVKDSASIQPFSLDGTTNRQVWLTVHVPDGTPSGKYTSQFTVSCDQGVLLNFPIEVEVLPFDLAPSRLTYSIYYNGYADKYTQVPFSYTTKTPEQYRLEMQDMKDHGVLYPTTYQILRNLDLDLKIRQEVGLPNDKIFAVSLGTGNPTSSTELSNLKSTVQQWKSKVAQYGYKELYAYGIDEAYGSAFTQQRAAWNAVHEAGAKIFVAGYTFYLDQMGDILDIGIIQGPLLTTQSSGYHTKGNKIYSYSNPQVGQENPEIYRRNFGLALWKNGYDGAMNYAYQKFYKSGWNDFDNTAYREETFTYQTSNGLLSTIEWEGFREGVDDTRYLATLLNKIDQMKMAGQNTSSLDTWVSSIDPNGNLDNIRSQIIDKILSINQALPVELSLFSGRCENGTVFLNWQTASEINNYGFEIERSGTDKKWTMIGFVGGNGSSNNTHNYQFTDKTPPSGTISYRIRQIDNNGDFKYYTPVAVTVNAPAVFRLLQNTPNPFNPSTSIRYDLPVNTSVSLKIYDQTGREIITLVNQEQLAGSHIVFWNGQNSSGRPVSSGIYIYKLSAGSYTYVRKMNFIK